MEQLKDMDNSRGQKGKEAVFCKFYLWLSITFNQLTVQQTTAAINAI